MNELVVQEQKQIAEINWTQEQIKLIKHQICKGATEEELQLFLYQCKRTGLDPLNRQIYAVFRETYDKALGKKIPTMAIQTSIDGFRLIAERTGKYAGQEGPFWRGEDGEWTDYWSIESYPIAAKVGVLRKDFLKPLYAVAHWDEYAQMYNGEPSGMWKKMPILMLAKCAESLALRKAFPQELSGIYSSDEYAHESEPAKTESKTPPVVTKPAVAPKVLPKETTLVIDSIGVTLEQRKRLIAFSATQGWTANNVKEYTKMKYNIDASKDLSLKQYDELFDYITKHPMQEPAVVSAADSDANEDFAPDDSFGGFDG